MPVKSRAKTGRRIPGSKSRGKTMKVTKIVKVREPKLQTKATIMDVVNRMLNRKAETKHIGQFLTTNAVQTGVSPFPSARFQNVIQPLGQG